MKQNECLISIVVPVYNVEKYLVRCLDSIINQSIREIEIILVDDGSTDISGDICDKYALQDERIKVIHKENGGLVSARQAGIKVASGQYIGFVDSDDWIESNMFQSLYKEAVLNNADAVAEGMLEDVEGEWKERRNKLQAAVYKTVEEREYLYQNMLSCEDFLSGSAAISVE